MSLDAVVVVAPLLEAWLERRRPAKESLSASKILKVSPKRKCGVNHRDSMMSVVVMAMGGSKRTKRRLL